MSSIKKTLVALAIAAIAVPGMALADDGKKSTGSSSTWSQTLSDSLSFTLASPTAGFTGYNVSVVSEWEDFFQKVNSKQIAVNATSLVWSLVGNNGYSKTGSFVDGTGSEQSETVSFANLAAGKYTFSLTGTWTGTTNKFSEKGELEIEGYTKSLVHVSAVPEPESYAMLLAGLGLIGSIVWRRKSGQAMKDAL